MAENEIPARLRQMRETLGLTQAEAAERLGTKLRTYQEWEHGRQRPATPEIISLACEALEARK